MRTIGSLELKAKLGSVLKLVRSGGCVTVTKSGVPVARLVPAQNERRADVKDTIMKMRELKKGNRLEGDSIRDLIEEGRS